MPSRLAVVLTGNRTCSSSADIAPPPTAWYQGMRRCLMLYCNYFRDGTALIEDVQQGDASLPIKLDERAAQAMADLLDLESFEVSHCLAALFNAGVSSGERAV